MLGYAFALADPSTLVVVGGCNVIFLLAYFVWRNFVDEVHTENFRDKSVSLRGADSLVQTPLLREEEDGVLSQL